MIIKTPLTSTEMAILDMWNSGARVKNIAYSLKLDIKLVENAIHKGKVRGLFVRRAHAHRRSVTRQVDSPAIDTSSILSISPSIVILESPYAGAIVRNVRYGQRALRDALFRGEKPFASHLIYPGALDDFILEERNLGIAAAYAFWPFAKMMVVYEDYGVTSGMENAISRWKQQFPKRLVEYRKIGINS